MHLHARGYGYTSPNLWARFRIWKCPMRSQSGVYWNNAQAKEFMYFHLSQASSRYYGLVCAVYLAVGMWGSSVFRLFLSFTDESVRMWLTLLYHSKWVPSSFNLVAGWWKWWSLLSWQWWMSRRNSCSYCYAGGMYPCTLHFHFGKSVTGYFRVSDNWKAPSQHPRECCFCQFWRNTCDFQISQNRIW